MSLAAENELETVINDDITTEVSDETEAGNNTDDALHAVESSEFALRLVNAVKAVNIEEISHYDLVNSFTFADEQKMFIFVYKSFALRSNSADVSGKPILIFQRGCSPKIFQPY